MSVDIATLGLEINSSGVVVASDRLKKFTQDGRNAEQATSKLSSATSQLAGYLKAAASAFGLYKLAEYAKEAALLAARYQTLGVVMNTVGATAGYTNAQMAGFEKQLQKQGIAMVESRQVLTQMAQAHLDLAKSSELARVAQDAATIGGINSSEAFERLVSGIQKGETEILKTIGITVNFEQAYVKLASQLGKSRDALSENEKTQARMNIVLERGKDIAGVYEAAMGTAGKQLTSMKRYSDNLKVTLGAVFNDALIVIVKGFTDELKKANKEAEEMQGKGKFDEWGKKLVYGMAIVADGINIAQLALQSLIITGYVGFQQLYYGAEALSFALIGDFEGAKKSFSEMTALGKDFVGAMAELWNNPTKFQDMADAMYSEREINKPFDAAAQKRLEKLLIERGVTIEQARNMDELNALIKKQNDEWGKIVEHQLESVGSYTKAAEEQIKVNKLTDDYKTMVQAAKKVPEAAAALKAQEILDQNKLLEAKRKEMQIDTDHQSVMLGIESQKLQSLGYDQESIYLKTGYLQALNEEKVLQDQIATEINPKKKAQMEEQLSAQQDLNRLIREETEERKRINDLLSQSAAYNDLIKMAKASGTDTKQLEIAATQAAYDAKRAQYQKAISDAQNSGNDALASITQQTLTQLNNLFAQKDANDANLAKLREILGVQQGITGETAKQKDNNALIDEYNQSITISRSQDEQYANDKYITSGHGRLELLKFYGTWTGYVEKMALDRIAAYEREVAEKQLIEDQKRLIEAISTAAEDLSTAATSLANAGRSLAEALRSASRSILSAQVDIAGGATSTLTPEQKYLMAKQLFLNTASQAQSTGDAELFSQLPELAKKMLEASMGYSTSSSVYASDYNTVQAILTESATMADSYANTAETIATLLEQQTLILTAIQTALETGGDTASLLDSLNTTNGQITTAVNGVNTSVGTVTTATNTVNTSIGSNTTATTSGTSTVSGWLSSVKDQTAATVTYTAGTKSRLDSSMLGSQLPGRINQATTTPLNAGQTIDWGSKTSYTYYARGGIANDPTGRSIFGEAGPEAAVPLPDGRSIPVTLNKSAADSYASKELVSEIQQLRSELRRQSAEQVKWTQKTARIIDKWDGDGMPAVVV